MDAPRPRSHLPIWLLSQIARCGDRLVGDALAEEGMGKHHFRVLLALREGGPASQAQLGRRLGIDRSDLHAVLVDLERGSLVTRLRDERDRRRNLVELTQAGVAALERLSARVEAAHDALLQPLSPRERRALTALLGRLGEHHAGRGRAAARAR